MALRSRIDRLKERIGRLKGIFHVARDPHRMVIVDDVTLKEKFSFRLTFANVFVSVGLTAILLVGVTTVIIAFTPLREYIPGYTSQKMVDQTYANAMAVDSLEHVVECQEALIADIQAVLLGKECLTADTVSAAQEPRKSAAVSYRHSKADSLLRDEVENKFNMKL